MSASGGGWGNEIADIINAFLVIIIIFALIFAVGGYWGSFTFWLIIGSIMIFLSNFLRRIGS